MSKFLNVLAFEYLTFVKSKYYIFMLVFMLVLGLALPSIPYIGGLGLFSGGPGGGTGERAAVLDGTGYFAAGKWAEQLPEYTAEYVNSRSALQDAVAGGGCSFGVEISAGPGGYEFTMYVPVMNLSYYATMESVSAMLRAEYRMRMLAEAGLSEQTASEILNFDPNGSIVTVAAPADDNASGYEENLIYAYAMIFLLYFGLLMGGQYVLTSVVREKTTKTMELLITSCKPSALINGKVFGVGFAALTQVALVAASAIFSMNMNSRLQAQEGMDVFTVAVKPDIIAFMVLFFSLGFFAYAYVYAALGSTVSRMEDANSAATLPMMLIIAAFFCGIFGMLNPGVLWVRVSSFIPFLSPMVMFMRVCMGTAALWEAWTAIALQFAAIMACAWLGAKIYRMGTLMYGGKPGLKTIAQAFRP